MREPRNRIGVWWDLLPVIRNRVYDPAFSGSYSLKAVLPALVPEMTYAGMAVANGQDAGLAWESLVRSGLNQSEREKTRKLCWITVGRTRWRW